MTNKKQITVPQKSIYVYKKPTSLSSRKPRRKSSHIKRLEHPEFLEAIRIVHGHFSSTDEKIYCLLAFLSQKHGYAFPSHAYLAQKAYCSLSTVKNTLKKLEQYELISIQNYGRINLYYVLYHDFMDTYEDYCYSDEEELFEYDIAKLLSKNIQPESLEELKELIKANETPLSSKCEGTNSASIESDFNSIQSKSGYNNNINKLNTLNPLSPLEISKPVMSDIKQGRKKKGKRDFFSKSSEAGKCEKAFHIFWEVYPVKQNRHETFKKFSHLYLSGQLPPLDTIIEKLKELKEKDSRWQRGKIPNPSNFLMGRRWEDSPFDESFGTNILPQGTSTTNAGSYADDSYNEIEKLLNKPKVIIPLPEDKQEKYETLSSYFPTLGAEGFIRTILSSLHHEHILQLIEEASAEKPEMPLATWLLHRQKTLTSGHGV